MCIYLASTYILVVFSLQASEIKREWPNENTLILTLCNKNSPRISKIGVQDSGLYLADIDRYNKDSH